MAADLTQLIAFAGFFSMFFYATLYMQEVLHYSPLKAGPPTSRSPPGSLWRAASPRSCQRIGTRPVVVAGCLVAASRDLLCLAGSAARLVRERPAARFPCDVLGAGSVFVSVTAAANAGVPRTKRDWPRACSTPPSSWAAHWASLFCPRSRSPGPTASARRMCHTCRGLRRRIPPCPSAGAILMAAAAAIALRIPNTRDAAPLVMVSTEVTPESAQSSRVTGGNRA